MGILNTTFIKVVEWLWLAFTVIVIIMLIGMKIGISSIRKKARRQQVYYAPNQIYVN
jgi:F0F1-type ATP synthase assembly protein I